MLYDNDNNPYRNLIPLITSCRLLSDAIAASSACHYAFNDISNQHSLSSPRLSASPRTCPASVAASPLDPTVQLVAKDLPESLATSPAYDHALRFKHRALHWLSNSLRDPVKRADDRTPAAILVLILLDSLESGGGAWRSHLEGVKSLLKCRGFPSEVGQKPNGSDTNLIIEGLASFVIDSCVSYV